MIRFFLIRLTGLLFFGLLINFNVAIKCPQVLAVEVKGAGGSDPKLQSKTAKSSFIYTQTISPDSGYDGLSTITIDSNGYGYTFYKFTNIIFNYDNSSYYSATLKLSDGTQETTQNAYHYNWDNNYQMILQKICRISIFLSFPQSPIKTGLLMSSGVTQWLYNKYNTGSLQAGGAYCYYPLYDSSYSNIINVMNIIYTGQLESNGVTIKFESRSIYNYWFYNSITVSSVELRLYI